MKRFLLAALLLGAWLCPALGETFSPPMLTEVSGSYTPVLTFGGASVGLAATETGFYVRESRTVHFCASFVLTAVGSSVGTAQITLPFTSSGNGGIGNGGSGGLLGIAHMANMVTSTGATFGFGGNTTVGSFELLGATSVAVMTNTNFTNTSQISVCASYSTNATLP